MKKQMVSTNTNDNDNDNNTPVDVSSNGTLQTVVVLSSYVKQTDAVLLTLHLHRALKNL